MTLAVIPAPLQGVDPAPRPTMAAVRDLIALAQSQLLALRPHGAVERRQQSEALNHLYQAIQDLQPRGGQR